MQTHCDPDPRSRRDERSDQDVDHDAFHHQQPAEDREQ